MFQANDLKSFLYTAPINKLHPIEVEQVINV